MNHTLPDGGSSVAAADTFAFFSSETDEMVVREAAEFLDTLSMTHMGHGKTSQTECNRTLDGYLSTTTEIDKKERLFAKLQPGRARKRINATYPRLYAESCSA